LKSVQNKDGLSYAKKNAAALSKELLGINSDFKAIFYTRDIEKMEQKINNHYVQRHVGTTLTQNDFKLHERASELSKLQNQFITSDR
jgi:hypothetical protein